MNDKSLTTEEIFCSVCQRGPISACECEPLYEACLATQGDAGTIDPLPIHRMVDKGPVITSCFSSVLINATISEADMLAALNQTVVAEFQNGVMQTPVTEEMIAAGDEASALYELGVFASSVGNAEVIYRAMTAVAPKPPPLVWTNNPANGVMTPHYPERARIATLEAERDEAIRFTGCWTETARHFSANTDYYRGLVDEIGEMFGVEARTADDGGVHDSILRAKVPELVRNHLASLRSDIRMLKADKLGDVPYHGPTRSVTDSDGNVSRESAPDPVHERVHEVVSDILGGRVIKPARDQMEKALADARVKDGQAPRSIPTVTRSGDPRKMGT